MAKRIRRRGATIDRLHPDPQWARPDWISLDGPWQFTSAGPSASAGPGKVKWDATIVVPFAPETPASGLNRGGYLPLCWYRRQFQSPGLGKGQRLILRCGAIDYSATVWINGRHAVCHEGGYTSFSCDITPHLRPGRAQEIVIAAEDDPHDMTKPRGKQDWQLEPHSIWYPRTTGVWQSVWLEVVGENWLGQMRWQPNLEDFSILLYGQTAGPSRPLQMRTKLRLGQRVLAEEQWLVEAGPHPFRHVFSLPHADGDLPDVLAWSPEQPTLIDAEIALFNDRDELLDHVHSYCAMRSVATSGGHLLLNRRPRYLRMALDQGYWPQSGLTPPDDNACRRDVELALAMGFNGIRAHQRIADPRYLYWADRLGLLVWEEMPSAYRFSSLTVRRLASQWAEAIERDASHPCIIAWVPINESWGMPDLPIRQDQRDALAALYHLTRSLDSTRPVIGNDGWEMDQTDIVAIHDYDRSPEQIRLRYARPVERLLGQERPGNRALLLDGSQYRGQPVMLTEFGGIALREQSAWGYTEVDSPQQLASHYRALLAEVRASPLLTGFCYTQFADTYQEANGLLRADRTAKFAIDEIRAATAGGN